LSLVVREKKKLHKVVSKNMHLKEGFKKPLKLTRKKSMATYRREDEKKKKGKQGRFS